MNILVLSHPDRAIMSVFIELCLLSKVWTTFRQFVLFPVSADPLSSQWLISKSVRIMVISLLKMLSQKTSHTIRLLNVLKAMDYVRHTINIINSLHWHISTRTQEPPIVYSAVARSIGPYVIETIIWFRKQIMPLSSFISVKIFFIAIWLYGCARTDRYIPI
jgi:hypothetical protein